MVSVSILTHNIQIESVTLSISLYVKPHTSIVASTLSVNPLQHERLVCHDDSLSDVMVQGFILRKRKR